MGLTSPPLVGKDGLVGVQTGHAHHGAFHLVFCPRFCSLLDLTCLPIQLPEAGSACLILDNGDQSPGRNSRGWRWRWRRRWWWFKLWSRWLDILPSLFPGFPSCSISCLASRSTMTTTALLARLLVKTSSCLVTCLWSSRASSLKENGQGGQKR